MGRTTSGRRRCTPFTATCEARRPSPRRGARGAGRRRRGAVPAAGRAGRGRHAGARWTVDGALPEDGHVGFGGAPWDAQDTLGAWDAPASETYTPPLGDRVDAALDALAADRAVHPAARRPRRRRADALVEAPTWETAAPRGTRVGFRRRRRRTRHVARAGPLRLRTDGRATRGRASMSSIIGLDGRPLDADDAADNTPTAAVDVEDFWTSSRNRRRRRSSSMTSVGSGAVARAHRGG